ncbi:phosphonoacetaldehyde hydrolase [Pararhodospirillum photometricum]|uniref:phosphonoacetaldehyde hydrolase n=1 Tax=Pararhodospirillum photometricum TaxID=1084 RepID=UPI0002E28B3C|nr:phosphonoacetaldehyde hydrolase [Pararhodospirillum photometricum]
MTALPPSLIRLVVFDWAGTIIDHGSRAPAAIFQQVFAEAGVPLSEAEARAPMGLPKLDHIKAIGALLETRWPAVHGRAFDDHDAQRLYEQFLPLQTRVVADYAEVIAGVAPVIAALRHQGIAIGTTTGYTRAVLEPCLASAARQGVVPDAMACAGDLPTGRPGPALMLWLMSSLGDVPPAAVVKVGDTAVDMLEGRNAGTWTVGVSETGNEIGLDAAALAALPAAERAQRRARAEATLRTAGAHFVIPSAADLLPVITSIEARLAAGERPS